MRELEKKADKYAYEVYSTRPLGDDPTDDEIKEAYIQGYKDAMAWHYPSKGDVPTDGEDTLIMFKYKGKKVFSVDKYSQFYNGWMFSPDPIAWMPLPDPPKEEA